MALLDIEDLCVEFGSETRPFRAVDHVSLTLARGEVLGIVGESGSGKSVTSLALMGLIDFPGRVRAQRLCFDGEDLLSLPERERRSLTGKDMAMVFQDPMGCLDPCYTVGFQIMETLAVHEGGSRRARRQRARELLESVGIPDPSSRLDAYPHQLSGGMSQRVMIALAIACNPSLLIADEPTTALDVTIQAQILDLLGELQTRNRMGMLLITHDLAVVAGSCSRVLVLYAGQVVESGTVGAVFATPLHPYTAALLAALPERAEPGARRLYALPGVVPGQYDRRDGCLLAPRCPHARPHCHAVAPALVTAADGRAVRCHTPLDAAGRPHGAVA